MEPSTTQKGMGPVVAPEFGAWPIEGATLNNVNEVRTAYNDLLVKITPLIAKGNERYLALVKTELEKACLFTIKGIAKPAGNA